MAARNDVLPISARGREPYRIINQTQDPQQDTPFMKLPTARPSDNGMRFFTPELYRQFNSPNDDEADRANEAWETALQEYRHHLQELWGRLPTPIRKLTELCLHDAELLGYSLEIEPSLSSPVESLVPCPQWSAAAVLTLQGEEHITTLLYSLWDRVRESPPPSDWSFSKERKHWLYDEVDIMGDRPSLFVHRVLFSDGRVMEIPFLTVFVHRFSLAAAEARSSNH